LLSAALRRWCWIGALALIVLAAVSGLSLLWWAQRPLPDYDGRLTLAGLEHPVRVEYGPHAVPSIRAALLEDLILAQGFVVARERLWQMDLLRRLAGGRLSEVFGEGALTADRFYRTIGLPRAAARSLDALEPRWQRLLRRYADGVNAYLSQAVVEGRLPLEYQLLGIEPSRWEPLDSLLVGAYMAWLNSVNLREELVFLRLAQRLGTQQALELFPTRPGESAPLASRELPEYRIAALPDPGQVGEPVMKAASREGGLPVLDRLAMARAASNAWAVTGARSAAGPLLANDPHLPAAMPGSWYELEMQAPGYHAAGAALPGVPFVVVGHNEELAWGVTAAVADTQDLFLERVAEDGKSVERPGAEPEPIVTRVESIDVAGRPDPVELRVRSTRHGVLIDELVRAPGANPAGLTAVRRPESLALRTTLDEPDRSLVAFWRLNTAATIGEARAAAGDLRQVSLNLIIAHRDGRIAWQVGGLVPSRGRGSGAFPVPGWEPGYGWDGYRSFAQNPGVSDPVGDLLVSANDAMEEWRRGHVIGYAWLAPFRAQRIDTLLRGSGPVDAAMMARMQSDRLSLEAVVYLEALRRQMPVLRRSHPTAASIAASRLLSWRGTFEDASESAAFFVLLRPALYRALYADELGPDLDALMSLEQVTYGPLAEAMRDDRSSFWDDVTTTDRQESAADIWARALHATVRALNDAMPDDGSPTLARLRALTFSHAFDGQGLLGDLFNVGPIGRGGDTGTIDVAIAPLLRPREVGNVASLRVVYTPSNWSATRGTLPLGQSGHRFSRFRSDQLEDWLAGDSHPWPWGGPSSGQALGELILEPGSASLPADVSSDRQR
jgi:acyl-homoserine lactone acylase PvdQ